jgi:hypothetical protein
LKGRKRASSSNIAGETLPDLVNPLVQRAESGLNASVVKAEQIEKQYKPEKPMVMRQVAKSLLRRTCDDVQDVQQDDHLISHKMTAERDRSS